MRLPNLRIVSTILLIAATACKPKPQFLGSHTASEWRYAPTPSVCVLVDTKETGALLEWRANDRTWVKQAPRPLTLRLRDGSTARFRAKGTEIPAFNQLSVHGKLESNTVATPARLTYLVNNDGSELKITVEADASAFLEPEQWEYIIPFRLDRHKYVRFQGDHGLVWEERPFYHFLVVGNALLKHPDTNQWRWYVAEQLTSNAYRIQKSESESTAPLVLHEGRRMAPYVQFYDEKGGITLHYPQLTQGARRAIRLDTTNGLTAYLAFRTPAPVQSPAASALGVKHEIILSAHRDEASLQAKRETITPSPSEPISTELAEPRFLQNTPQETVLPRYVTGGYPFPKGSVRDLTSLGIESGGASLPVQTKPLGYWPDGSIKWAAFTFPLPTSGAGASTGPKVTFRDGTALPITVAPPESTVAPTQALSARQLSDGAIEITNGSFQFRFNKGSEWLDGQHGSTSLFASAPRATVHLRRDVSTHPPFALHITDGALEVQTLQISDLKLEEAGPLRAVVRLEGMTTGKEPNRIILRATFLAGRPEVTFNHTIEFLLKDPRRSFITAINLDFPLAQAEPAERGIVQETYDARWSYGPVDSTESGWLAIPLRNGLTVQGGIRRMAETAPKAVLQRDNTLSFALWPDLLSPMDLRRYSNRPHRGQGESNDTKPDWVERVYYANQPVVGISRTHEVRLAFHSGNPLPSLASLAADFDSPPLLYPGWETVLNAGVILPAASQEGWKRFWTARENLARFWLYHRELYRWYGYWFYGDFRHHFREGYGWITSPKALATALATPNITLPNDSPVILDYFTSQDWAYDNGRWGRSNSEGLGNLFLQHEYLRTGNRALYFAAEAMAHYCRDVVVRHDQHLRGRGTRHGVQPWSDGNHEERQTTSTEFRLHYFLSGDGRTRDVAEKLYREYYSKSRVASEAAHSGRWGGLLFHHELSGSTEEAEQLRRYAHSFIAPDDAGLYLAPNLRFPGPKVIGSPQSLNAAKMFFACFGAMHGLLEYQQIFDDEALKRGIIRMAEAVLANRPNAHPIYTLPVIAFAARHAESPQPFRDYLLKTLGDQRHWPALYQNVTANPAHWSGSTAFLYRNTPGVFFLANWMPYLTSLFPSDIIWNSMIAAKHAELEAQGTPPKATPLRWRQRELDPYVTSEGDYIRP